MLRDKPTFDPYSIGEFSLRDALHAGRGAWKRYPAVSIALATTASLPTILAFLYASTMAIYSASVLTLLLLISILSPTIARHARGLRADFKDSLYGIKRRAGPLSVSIALLSMAVIGPSYCGYLINVWWMCGGLLLGSMLTGIFLLSIPVILIENVSLVGAFKRSLFLVRGRPWRTIPPLIFTVFVATLPSTLSTIYPTMAAIILIIQPVILAWCSIGIGVLYTNLYDR